MNRFCNTLYQILLVVSMLAIASCKKHDLEDFSLSKTTPLTVSAGSMVGDIKKDNEKISFKVRLALSEPAKKAFQVGLEINNDTLQSLIDKGLAENTAIASPGSYFIPNVAEVAFGVDSASFDVQISLTEIERQYGKKIGLAIKLIEPSKGNNTNPENQTSIVIIDTKQVIDEGDIHYLSITNGGGAVLEVVQGVNYRVTSAGVTIPLGISLAGVPGRSFQVKSEINIDTIAALIADGTLPANTVALQADDFNIDSLVSIGGNLSQAPFELSIPWHVMDENLNNVIAVVISLDDPTRHVLHPVNRAVVVMIDPSVSLDNNSFIEGNGTGLLAEYFKEQTLDEGGKVPDVVRIDERIDFGGWQPIPDAGDNWSSKWTGEFHAPVRGEYIFYQTKWDDGARLIINGQAIIDDFTAEWDKPSRVGKIFLERGQRYTIEAHHRENVGGQQARLEYEVPSADIPRQIVPKSLLYPASRD